MSPSHSTIAWRDLRANDAIAQGPNPFKVAIILEELGIPYERVVVEMADMKKEPFEKINPNGRVPAIEDPNTGITLWESGAIIEYLIETYDKSNKLSYGDKSPEKFLTKQWLHFQVSGQGPYFGQAAWFTNFHPEKNITSAIDRYRNEVKRVNTVIDRHLAKNGTGWLVGDKITYADLSFYTWHLLLPMLMGDDLPKATEGLTNYNEWIAKMEARPSVAKIIADRKASMAKK